MLSGAFHSTLDIYPKLGVPCRVCNALFLDIPFSVALERWTNVWLLLSDLISNSSWLDCQTLIDHNNV